MYARFFRWASDRLDANGILAFVTNRSFIESRTFDGFRKTVAQEFSDIYVVDLGGDVRANPKLSGTKHNVFGIQTGVAISFLVKRLQTTKDKRPVRVHYVRRPEMETAEEKHAFLASQPMRAMAFDEVSPDKNANWINLTHNDFETLLPLASKETKAAKTAAKERAIFKLFTNAVNTARDDWVYDFDAEDLEQKVSFLIASYNKERKAVELNGKVDPKVVSKTIKWSAGLLANVARTGAEPFDKNLVVTSAYRPFFSQAYYAAPIFSDRLTGNHIECFGADFKRNSPCIALTAPGASKTYSSLATKGLADWHFLGDTQLYPLKRTADGPDVDNITDWALKQFAAHYAEETGKGKGARKITKQAIFHYCYAVLHDPVYREKYAQNLKRDFPRIPFYAGFWRWAEWGEALMALHIGYEQVKPFGLTRQDAPDTQARAAGQHPKALLKSDPTAGSITLDTETTLRGVPPEAWAYKLGNRCAIDWVLDQHKEKKPKDPTIREQFDTYRFADHKEKVIDLLQRVTTVSVETVRITEVMKGVAR